MKLSAPTAINRPRSRRNVANNPDHDYADAAAQSLHAPSPVPRETFARRSPRC
nr:hypothetical protein JVH1_4869 [Rhodococcus sp. JVH1]